MIFLFLLAGSQKFAEMNVDIMRRAVHVTNLDIFGWTNDKTYHEVSPELMPFHRHVVAQSDVTLPMQFIE